MQIHGEKRLPTPREGVWRALNDPQVLQRCLAGCDTFEPAGENRYKVSLQAAVGPVRARFAGKLELRDIVVPTSYALAFEGSGGVAGFGKGTARVVLEDAEGGTLLRYEAQAQVGGRLAQVGDRLIEGVTRRMADDFFSRFVKEVAPQGREAGGADAPAHAPATPPPAASPASAASAAPVVPAVQPLQASARVPEPAQAAVQAAVQAPGQAQHIAIVAAAVSATAACVAVLAALFTVLYLR